MLRLFRKKNKQKPTKTSKASTTNNRNMKAKLSFSKKFVASIDLGTTSCRCIIFNHDTDPVAVDQREHRQIYPQEGYVEHDPIEILENTKNVIAGALSKAKLKPSDIAAVGITNQRETTVVWDKRNGKPYCNAIVWMDMRSQHVCNQLSKQGGKDQFREKTGLPISPYFSGTKLKWILENVEGVAADAENGHALFGTIDTWLLWNLSNGKHHITDVTNASRTLLMNLQTLNWDDELIKAIGIPKSMLPEIKSSSEVYFNAELDVLKGVPVAGVLGDQQAALFGQTCYSVGDAKNTYGTGCFLLLNTGEKIIQSTKGLLTTVAFKLGDGKAAYALEGSVAIGGASVQWLRDNLNMIDHAPEVEKLAKEVDDNGGVYFVPAFSGLYAPYWRDDARGAIVGLTRYANKNHLARATLEAVGFQSYDVFEAMKQDAGVELNELRVDGGMVVNDTLMQFQSDILNVPVIRPKMLETTALGAAYAAGLAIGYWESQKELKEKWNVSKTWKPAMVDTKRTKLQKQWKKAIQRTLDWVSDSEDED